MKTKSQYPNFLISLLGITLCISSIAHAAIYTGGNGAGWSYSEGANAMYHGGSGDGDTMLGMTQDAPIGFGSATRVIFTTSPSNAYAGVAFGAQPVVEIRDAGNNLVSSATNTVVLSILNDPPGASILGGTTSMAAVAGIANFSGLGLNISRAGNGFTLSATSSGLTSDVSTAFNILSSIQVSFPNGAEVLTVSSPYNITWNTFGSLATGTNTVQYSLDNGFNWTTLSTNATSPFSWVTPATSSTQALVRVSNSADSTFIDTSDAVFKIAAGFNVVTPNGGEVWASVLPHTIQWQTTGAVANVKLEYSSDGGSIWNTFIASTANNNQYTLTPNVAGGINYLVRISDVLDSTVKDESNSVFTMQRIVVTAPTSGQRIQAGSSANITWTSGGVSAVKIEYSVNDGAWIEITPSTPAAAGSYSWSVPSNFTTSTNVKVRVSSTTTDSDGNTASSTSSAFTVYGQLTLTAPNGAEQWTVNTANNITWNTNLGTINNVKLEYSTDNFVADINTIIASTPNTGTYSWIPTITGSTFKIRISDAQDAQVSDVSNNYFLIIGIGITAPAAGATWACGSNQNITWNYTGSFTNVKIEYSIDNGSTWNVIANSTLNDGSYTWPVANTPTTQAKIRISDAADGDPAGVSGIFNLKSVVSVTAPNGTESYAVGDSANITWLVTGNVSNVKIEYSTDNGANYNNVIESEGAVNDGIVANDGVFSWSVPDAISLQCLIRISDVDAGHPASNDTSNAVFTIKAGLTITSPTSGLNWAVNEAHNISWSNTGTVGQVRLYFATERDSYATWSEITSGPTINNNNYSWTVSNIILAVAQDPQLDPNLAVKVKVVDAVAGHPSSEAVSVAFNVIYYTITFTVKDSQTQSDLSGLSVNCSSGWSASNLTSGISTMRNYPYGTYTTIWSKALYTDSSLSNWVADSSKTMAVTMTLAAVAGQEYHVYSNFTYDAPTDSFLINSWIEKSGAIVTGSTNCTVSMEDKDGNSIDINGAAIGNNLISSSPNANGVFRMSWDLTNINRNTTYFGKVQIVYLGAAYSSNVTYTITVPALSTLVTRVTSLDTAMTQHRQATEGPISTIQSGITTLQTDVTSIKTAVGADESTTIYSKVTGILTDTGTNIPLTIANELKKGPRAKILNRPTSVSLGDKVSIRYQTESGKSPAITVYDADNLARVSGAAMTEIGTTGVYEYDVTFQADWGTGDYTVICSEPTTASADSMIINAGSVGGLSGIEKKIDALTANLDTISNYVSSLKTIIGTTSDSATSNTVYGKLSAVSTNVESIISKWKSYNAADIIGYIDTLETYLGVPTNSAGQQTVFGRIAEISNQTEEISGAKTAAASIYSKIQQLRKEINFNGKSETAYNLAEEINESLKEAKGLVDQTLRKTEASEIERMSASIEATKKALKETALKEGLKGSIIKEAPKGPVTLDSLQNQIVELKALTEAIKAVVDKETEEPVIKTWFESGSVILKIIVANPSLTETKIVPVKSYLPNGVEPEDLMEVGDFKVNYDFEQSLYYVWQEVTLEPKETVELKVEIRDIWVISNEEINSIREQVNRVSLILKKSQYYNQAKLLSDSILQRLDEIVKRQNVVGVNVEKRLSDYEVNLKILSEVKRDLGALEELASEVGGGEISKKILGESESAKAIAMQEFDKNKISLGTIKFKIAISNPSGVTKIVPIEYYLPKEASPQFIVDSGGLEVGFSHIKSLHYVYAKEGIELKAGQTKEFSVEIKDIWFIPEAQIETLKMHTEKLKTILSETDFKESANFLSDKILSLLKEIIETQNKKDIIAERRIGDYRRNLQRLEEARKDLAKLERLVILAGGSPGLTLIGKGIGGEKGEGGAGGEGILRAKGIELLAKSVFRGKAPDVATTWKIIWIIIGFLAIFSSIFFIAQLARHKKMSVDVLTGTFAREYILERLKEEMWITSKFKRKCSLLLLDIDKFKSINDTYGHSAGDIVLRQFIIATKKGLRRSELIGRLGGDEFLVILPAADREIAVSIAEKIRKYISEQKIRFQDKTLNITSSIGITTFPDDSTSLEDLIKKADRGMYEAKEKGGDAVAGANV